MIIIKGSEYIKNGDGVTVPIRNRIIDKYDNYHNFGFDIFEPKNWKKFIEKYTTKDGKYLPRKSQQKDVCVRYCVYMFGIQKDFPRKFDGHKTNVMFLFPDYDYEKKKVLSIFENGVIE